MQIDYFTPQKRKGEEITEERKQLYKSLHRALNELKNPKSTKTNPFFQSQYAPLSQVLEEAKKVLRDHGLFIYQQVGGTPDKAQCIWVESVIAHENGAEIRSGRLYLPIPDKKPQTAGSAITYARRYSLMAILGVAGEDEDDDANTTILRKNIIPPREFQKKKKQMRVPGENDGAKF